MPANLAGRMQWMTAGLLFGDAGRYAGRPCLGLSITAALGQILGRKMFRPPLRSFQ